MTTLLDIFGYLTVVLRGFDLAAQTILVGSVSFVLFVAVPSPGDGLLNPVTVILNWTAGLQH